MGFNLKDYLDQVKADPKMAAEDAATAGLAGYGRSQGGQDFAAALGLGGKTGSQKSADAQLAAALAAYQGLTPPTLSSEHPDFAEATDQGPSALGQVAVNPADRQAQMAQLGALQSLAANGGRNAASDYNLAQIQEQEQAAAKGQRDAILQNASARGVGGSGASLLAQLTGAQNEQNNQSLQDMNVRGQEQNQALQAGQAAANLGSQMENTDYQQQANKAAANDAIARFNAGQRTGISQTNAGIGNQAQQYNTGLQQTGYQNQFQKAAGTAGANMGGVNYYQNQANMQAQQAGGLIGGLTGLGTAALAKPNTVIMGSNAAGAGGAGGAAGGSALAGGADASSLGGAATVLAASYGGKIPGSAPVSGNSPRNDIVPTMTSPGEVVVPRSVAKSGNSLSISNFVKHPPQVKVPQGAQDREAMLSALANIRRRR